MGYKIYNFKEGGVLLYKKVKVNKASTVCVGIKSGGYMDDENPGISHFFEHMMFKKTTNRTKEQLDADMRKYAKEINAHTGRKFMHFDFTQSNSIMEKTFELVSDMFLNSVFDAEDIEVEKKVILEELGRSKDNNERVVFELLDNSAYKYKEKKNILGTEESIKAITSEKLVEFRNKFFNLNNFCIAVAGSISFSKIKKLTQKYFISKLKQSKSFKPFSDKDFVLNGKPGLSIIKKDTKTVQLIIAFPKKTGFEDVVNRNNLSVIINSTSGINGRFWNWFRRKEGLSYFQNLSAYGYFKSGLFYIKVQTGAEKIDSCIKASYNFLNDIVKNGIYEDELKDYKLNFKLSKDKIIPNHRELPNFMIWRYDYFGFFDKPKTFEKRLKKLTVNDLNKLIREDIDYFSPYVAIVGNVEKKDIMSYAEIKKLFFKLK